MKNTKKIEELNINSKSYISDPAVSNTWIDIFVDIIKEEIEKEYSKEIL